MVVVPMRLWDRAGWLAGWLLLEWSGGRGGGTKIGWWQCFRAVRAGPGPGGLAAVALGPKRARPKTLPPTNFRGEAGIILGSFWHHFKMILR